MASLLAVGAGEVVRPAWVYAVRDEGAGRR